MKSLGTIVNNYENPMYIDKTRYREALNQNIVNWCNEQAIPPKDLAEKILASFDPQKVFPNTNISKARNFISNVTEYLQSIVSQQELAEKATSSNNSNLVQDTPTRNFAGPPIHPWDKRQQ